MLTYELLPGVKPGWFSSRQANSLNDVLTMMRRLEFKRWPKWAVWLLKVAIVTLVVSLASQLALQLTIAGTNVSVLWLPAGISLASILIFGYSIWPGITLATSLTTFLFVIQDHSLAAALIATAFTAAADTLAPLLGAYWTRRAIGDRRPVDRTVDLLRLLVLGGALAQVVNAVLSITGTCLSGLATWTNFWPLLLNRWLTDLAAVLLLTPFLLVWTSGWQKLPTWRQVGSAIFIYFAMAVGAWLAFFFQLSKASVPDYFEYLTVPLVLWVTFRLGQRGATLSILISASIAVWGTINRLGPFTSIGPAEGLLLMQVYLATLSLMALIVASVLSERKKVAHDFEENQRVMSTLLSNLQGMAYRCRNDRTWTMEFVSQGSRSLTGYAPQDLIDNKRIAYNEIIHPTDRQAVADEVDTALAANKPFELTYRIITLDGQTKWVWEQGRGIQRDGALEFIEGYITDITELKQTEKALAYEQSLLRALMDNTPDHIYFKDIHSRFIRVSRSHIEKFGIDDPEQAVGKTDFDFFAEEQAQKFYNEEQEIMRTGRPMVGVEELETRPSRDSTWVSTTKIPLCDQSGSILGTFGISRDITERKQSEEALRQNEEKYRTTIEQFAEGFALVDQDGRIIEWNQAMEAITGIKRSEGFGTFYWDLQYEIAVSDHKTGRLREQYKELVLEALQTGQASFLNRPTDVVIQGRDGVRRTIQELSFTIKTETGYRMGHITQDITQRKQREQELESIATMSAALRNLPTRAELLPAILNQLTQLFNIDGAAIGIRDQATGETVFEITHGVFQTSQGIRLSPGQGIIGEVISTGLPYLSSDLSGLAHIPDTAWFRQIRAMAVVPLAAQGNIIGALAIGQNADILPEEMRLLTAIADMTANAIHRTTLHEQTQRRLMNLTALRKIDLAISNSLDLKITLTILLEQTLSQLRVDAADILLLNPHMHTLEFAAGQVFTRRTSSIPA